MKQNNIDFLSGFIGGTIIVLIATYADRILGSLVIGLLLGTLYVEYLKNKRRGSKSR